jgi:WD repeat-containing protein 35
MDDVMSRPDTPNQQDIVEIDTKSLRDTRSLLDKINLGEATQYIEKNSHPRLWYSICFIF